ncbi:M64 family metallopeptidase [Streptomyces sp. NPDC050803]|uniref:M64 family metallopeptidase n=1 Tax=unclassified Streptomyces TaxID=2593676 RepID=UPI003432D978
MKVVDFVLGDAKKAARGWTLAVVPEGYTQAELDAGLFDRDVAKVVEQLLRTAPFNHPELKPLINVVMVRRASARTGNTITLLTPTPTSSPFMTAWGAMFGRYEFHGQQVVRTAYGNSQAVRDFVRGQPGLASVGHFLVLINNTLIDGGYMDNGVGWSTKFRPAWPATAVHELGHQAFDLADEYPYLNKETDPVSRFNGSEPQQPNATTVTDVDLIKWSDLITVARTQVPTTEVRPDACVRNHPVVSANPPIPADAVGAYEGALHADCGVFRPSLDCLMRDETRPFCKVCELRARTGIGHYMLDMSTLPLTPSPAGAWTHMLSFDFGGKPPRMLAYNAFNGTYAISNVVGYYLRDRRPDGSPPVNFTNPAEGTGSIGPDWTWLVPFVLGRDLHYFGHQFGSGAQGIFTMNRAGTSLTATHTTPPGQASHTHVVSLNLDGAPHYIGYNTFTGDAALFRINSDTAAPVHVTTMQWGPGHTAVVATTVDGRPFALTYKMATGEVLVRHLTPPGFTMTFASPSGFWKRNITHVALLDMGGRPYLVRYSGLDGRAAIHHLRRDGKGVDFVCSVPAPGLGGLSLLGVGAPAVGLAAQLAGDTKLDQLYVYNALHSTLTLTTLTVR